MWKALLMSILLQNVAQGDVTGSGSASTVLDTAPKCIEATAGDFCNIVGSSTDHLLINTDQFDQIFTALSVGYSNRTYICRQFVLFAACFYTFRACDDSGAQLLICEDICYRVTQLYNDCVRPDFVYGLINGTDNPEIVNFLKFSLSFDCYKKETYAIQGVNISNFCQELSFINDFFPADATDSENDQVHTSVVIGLAVGIPVLIITLSCTVVILLLVVARLHKSKIRLEKRVTGNARPYRNDYNTQIEERSDIIQDITLSAEEQCFYEERFDRAVIAFDKLQMEDNIGEGTFGVVCKAILVEDSSALPVAVKKPQNLSSKQQLRSLLSESLLMKRFDHPNIVGLLGVCLDTPDSYPYLILPFMANGNIRDYLKDRRVHPANTSTLPHGFSMDTLVSMCVDVAKGMEYLSSNKFVHRDLAARNCMMDEQGKVKVGDFGLARDVYTHLYYRGDKYSKIPVKWSAPEMLHDGLCTEKSDVWSYGVVCWEVFSLGRTPYPGVDNYAIPQFVTSGERLKKPELCPQHMYVIVEKCWKVKPEARPDFKQLVTTLSEDVMS